MTKIDKGQDYWYIQMIGSNSEIKAATNDHPQFIQNEWNMFVSRKEAERALGKIIVLLTEEEE